ncbi:MAG: arsenate reductase ArsC [Methylocystaceae bacterium]
MKKRVLFVCTQNSSRSQMAEGLMKYWYGDDYAAFSAGTSPFRVNPYAIRAMAEMGIDISSHYSKSINEFAGQEFDYIVTVCDHARETCPYFPGGKEYIHHSFEDPAAAEGSDQEMLTAFIRVRDEIKSWLDRFVNNHS